MLKAGLYIVATPIGNLDDITLRAIKTLSASDLILCEDTRNTKILLEKHGINTKTYPYNDHSTGKDREYITKLIEEGKALSLVSDAGTPLISDPGYKLVESLRKENHHVEALPGPCSVITGLCASGIPSDKFIFIGFPPKSEISRQNFFSVYKELKASIIFFESPHRLVSSLKDAEKSFGNRYGAVARELTKIYQEVKKDTLSALASYYEKKPPKGEIVVMISGHQHARNIEDEIEAIQKDIESMSSEKMTKKDMATELAKDFKIPKKAIYKILHNEGTMRGKEAIHKIILQSEPKD
jgi:16S rRNA (cytidine1402-2'-O)-methyltransferase